MNLNDTHVPPPFSAWSSYVQLCPAATEALSSATARPCFSVWSSRDKKNGKNWIFRPPFQLVSLSLQTYFNYDLNKQPAKGIEGPLVKRHTFGMPPCVPRPTKVFTTFACFRLCLKGHRHVKATDAGCTKCIKMQHVRLGPSRKPSRIRSASEGAARQVKCCT